MISVFICNEYIDLIFQKCNTNDKSSLECLKYDLGNTRLGFPNLVLKYIIVIVIYFLFDKLIMNIHS